MLKNIVLLAAPSPRSQTYLQALVAAGLAPDRVILMATQAVTPQATARSTWHDIFLPDLGESIASTCHSAGIALHTYQASSVNAPEIEQALRDSKADVAIYSGFGGQIVAPHILHIGPRFLHCHAGKLPDYRGSTTLYYALLQGQRPTVTAIYLDTQIDTGPIIASQDYPPPDAGMDIDKIYDNAIRADLLVRIMQRYASTGRLDALPAQDPAQGRDYYVIHPVLKHLAILSLSNKAPI